MMSPSEKEESEKLVKGPKQTKGYTDEKDQDSEEEETPKPGSGIFGASFNMTNATIGNGIVATPFAIAKCGILLGTFLFVLVALVADYALKIIIKAASYADAHSYQDVMHAAFGTAGFTIITVMQFLFSYLSLISYHVLIGDTVAGIIAGLTGCSSLKTIFSDHRFIIFLAAVVVIFPLSLVRNVSRYAKVSFISVIMIMTMTVIVIYNLVVIYQEERIPQTPDDWYLFSMEFPNGVSMISVLFACHHMSFVMFESLKNKTEKTWSKVVHFSMGAMLIIVLTFSIGGYATYRAYTQADLSENLCLEQISSHIFRIALTIILLFIYPLDCFVVKTVIEGSLFRSCQPQPCWRNVIVVIGIICTTAGIAMVCPCVDIVLEINGILNALPMVFIIPPLCLMKLRPESLRHRKNIVPVTTAVLGIIFFILGTYQVAMHFKHGIQCQQAGKWPYCASGGCLSKLSESGNATDF